MTAPWTAPGLSPEAQAREIRLAWEIHPASTLLTAITAAIRAAVDHAETQWSHAEQQRMNSAVAAERERCAGVAKERADGWRGAKSVHAAALSQEGCVIANEIRGTVTVARAIRTTPAAKELGDG